MNTTEVSGNWNATKGKLKQKFAMLTDNDLMFADGKKDELIGRLQVKAGQNKRRNARNHRPTLIKSDSQVNLNTLIQIL